VPVDYLPYDPNNAGHEVINAANDVDLPKILKAHLDLIVGAFTCDITRVASLIATPSRSDVVMSWLGLNMAHHEMSHQSDAAGAPGLIKVNTWYAQQIADFITALKAVPEGNGTLFDNTVILWCNELGIGNIHSHTRVPFLLAGSCGGYLKTGRYLSFPQGTPHNNLLASIALAMGVGLTNNTFGDPAFCTGPLPGLTG
jgi:ribosomal protein L30/L7E